MQFLDTGLAMVRSGSSFHDAAERILERCISADEAVPGFGHRFHTRDPRAARLFQMALELELEAEHIKMIRSVEMVLREQETGDQPVPPVNIDGAQFGAETRPRPTTPVPSSSTAISVPQALKRPGRSWLAPRKAAAYAKSR